MILRNRLIAEADGVASGRAKLPSAVTLTIVPLVIYGMTGRGMATVPSWSDSERSGDVATMQSTVVELQIVPSLWIFLLCVGIALGAHVAAKRINAIQPVRAVDLRIASVIVIWIVVGLAFFGSWAWVMAVGSGTVEPSVPFPLMGYLTTVAA